METTGIAQEIESLPPEAQRLVIDFVAFLRMRYPVEQTDRESRHTKLADEPFIGMWRGREDMQDGTVWVQNLRRRE